MIFCLSYNYHDYLYSIYWNFAYRHLFGHSGHNQAGSQWKFVYFIRSNHGFFVFVSINGLMTYRLFNLPKKS